MYDDAGRAAFINSQVACMIAEIQGMIEENQHRANCGLGVAYGKDSFSTLESKYHLDHNDVIEFLRAGR